MRLFSTLGLLILVWNFGCSPQADQTAKNTLLIGLSDRPTTLDPRFATDANSKRINDLRYQSLVAFDNQLRLSASAASWWQQSARKLIFHVKRGSYFRPGRAVTLDDVAQSIEAYRKPHSNTASFFDAIDKVTVAPPDQIILTLKYEDASLLNNFVDIKIMPAEFCDAPQSDDIPGSGLFEKVDFDNNELRLSRRYLNPQSNIQTLLFKFVRDENTRYLKIIKGELDVLLNELSEEKVHAIQKSGQVQVLVSSGLNFNYVLINLKNKPFDQLRVRQALFVSMNRDELVHYKLDNLAFQASSILAPLNPFAEPTLHFSRMSLTEAQKVIRDVGLDKQNVTLKTSDQALPNGEALAHQWTKALHIKITHQSYEWATFYSDVRQGRFELALMRWVGIVDPDVYRDTLASTEWPPGRNRGFYKNLELDSIVNEARHSIDDKRRHLLYSQAQEIVAQTLPILPLWYNANVSVLSSRLSGFIPAVTGSFMPLTLVTKK